MRFKFDERRATQAAAVLLRLSGGRQNYTWLIKALYIADRVSLRNIGAPIAGASFCNMANGPLASDVYDCVKGSGPHPIWNEHIRRKDDYDVVLIKDPGDGELSDYDVDLLSRIYRKCEKYSFSGMIKIVHRFKEWEDTGATSEPLPVENILLAAGADDDEIAEFEENNLHLRRVDSLFA
jgi:uncharacterized phage-associated protein